ncbi:MAG TPA: acyl-CoA thioesterase [Bacillales bacterium]|nr:acyl-CoA thioesterase [Bacillales bacterium]
MEAVSTSKSRTVKTALVLPPDTNHLDTMFGGKVLSYIDEVAAIAAMRHCRMAVVTASIDSVDFYGPVKEGDVISVEAFVISTGRTSMEVYVKVLCENLEMMEPRLTTTSFLTMIALDRDGRPASVPAVHPETAEEKQLYSTAPDRRQKRKERTDTEPAGSL